MSDFSLSGLDVHAADVLSVEREVLSKAEANAVQKEKEERTTILKNIDEQLSTLQDQERKLASGKYTSAASRQLQALKKRIDALHLKRRSFVEAEKAREELRDVKSNSTSDRHKNEGESERDFLIRTGKLTPFEGKVGYERKQAGPTRRARSTQQDVKKEAAGFNIGYDHAQVYKPILSNNSNENHDVSQTHKPSELKEGSLTQITKDFDVAGTKESNSDNDYIPDASELRENSGGESSEGSAGNDRSERRKKRKITGLAQDNLRENISSNKHFPETDDELEGSDWEPEDKEEVEFDGGLRIPASVYDKLFEYQKTGVQWLWELHTQGTGGILGDEMGLGKTVQIVTFLAALDYSGKLESSVIIIAPATVLRQWKREFRTWWPRFRVRILHHSQEQLKQGKKRKRSSKYDPDIVLDDVTHHRHGVLITSYEQVRKHHDKLVDKFQYVIADEGHKMKSPDAEITLVCKQFDTPHRIIVSGSPLQNHLKELWSLFDFVYPGKLGTLPVFQAQFIVPITMGGYSTASKAQVHTAFKCSVVLRDLICPYLLRRMKKDVATQLPEKNEQILFVKITQDQRDKYEKFLKSRFVRQVLSGKLNLLYAITALRKICNHPDIPIHKNDNDATYLKGGKYAPQYIPTHEPNDVIPDITQDADYGDWKKSGKMIVLDRILSAWKKAGSRVLLFSQTRTMLDILESFVKEREYSHQRMDGLTPVGNRMSLIDTFNNDESVFVFLLTTRVGGLGVNLTGADRVVLFDPDWNPSTDLQARERAWRVGQKRPVTVYRLVTTGTIEEKIYHRQIYKQFLTNKVLNDPRQRRFFKQKDIKDLFTLGDEEEQGTETGDIFSGTAARESTAKKVKSTRFKKTKSGEEEKDKSENGSASLLNSLLDNGDGDGALHSTMNHDAIMGAGTEVGDASLVEHEADTIASKALQELQKSARRRGRERVGVPTWTGKSGLAGYVSGAKRNNGNSKAASLLQRIRERQGLSASAPGNSSGEAMSSSARLLRDIVQFLKSRGGQSTSAEMVSHFQDKVEQLEAGAQGFKSLLKQVAILKKGEGPGNTSVWKLRARINNNEAL